MSAPLHLAIVFGSTRPGRFCDKVVRWAAAQAARHDSFAVTVVDPAHREEEDGGAWGKLHTRPRDADRRAIAEADAFVVVTPEYNHGYSGPLKTFIDSMGPEWQGKPVAFISYGGVSGGLRAVEQLRLVFAELNTVTVRDSVSFANAGDQFDDAGELREPARAERSMATLLKRLHWWARALSAARQAHPFTLPS